VVAMEIETAKIVSRIREEAETRLSFNFLNKFDRVGVAETFDSTFIFFIQSGADFDPRT